MQLKRLGGRAALALVAAAAAWHLVGGTVLRGLSLNCPWNFVQLCGTMGNGLDLPKGTNGRDEAGSIEASAFHPSLWLPLPSHRNQA